MTYPRSARQLLADYGLNQGTIDGILDIHTHELAEQQRRAHDEQRPRFHMGQPCNPGFNCHVAELINLIDPAGSEPQ